MRFFCGLLDTAVTFDRVFLKLESKDYSLVYNLKMKWQVVLFLSTYLLLKSEGFVNGTGDYEEQFDVSSHVNSTEENGVSNSTSGDRNFADTSCKPGYHFVLGVCGPSKSELKLGQKAWC